MEEKTKAYIDFLESTNNSTATTQRIKDVLKMFHSVGLLEWAMQSAIEFMNSDLQSFIIEYVSFDYEGMKK